MNDKKALQEAILVFMKEHKKVSFQVSDISEGMGLTSAADFKVLVSSLAEMEREGKLFLNKKGNFKLPSNDPVLTGTFRASDRGFGFVAIEDEEKDIYIPPNMTNFALDGDKVTVDIIKPAEPWSDKGAEGKIKAIIERKIPQLIE